MEPDPDVQQPGGDDPWGPGRDHYSPLGEAEEEAVKAMGLWWSGVLAVLAIGWRRFWGPRLKRLGAQLKAFRHWASLALAPKTDAHVAELASVQNHLLSTPFSPFRVIAWVTMGISALFALMWGWVAFVMLPAAERARDAALAERDQAFEANGKWKAAWDAQKRDADATRAAMALQASAQAKVLVDAGARAAVNETIRRNAAQRQKEIRDAGRRPDTEPFDGAGWVRRRLEAAGGGGADPGAGAAPAPGAGVAPGVLPEGG